MVTYCLVIRQKGFVFPAFLGIYKNNKRLIEGADYAHSDD
jgi:hypothetical protein